MQYFMEFARASPRVPRVTGPQRPAQAGPLSNRRATNTLCHQYCWGFITSDNSATAVLRIEQRHFMNPREFQLLLYCARSRPDAGSVRDLVSKGIDWQILLKLAAQHCVRPMLLQTLKSVCWDAVPPKIQLELTLFNKANVQKNLLFTGELLQLLGLFQQNAIPIAAFKGPVLAHSVYGHISLREFSDLDIIVREADLSKAEDILTARGYQADFANRDYRSAFLSYQGQYAF